MSFQINNDIRGLIDSVNDGSTSAFMWEWFTTKPFVDAGEVKFIGSVPTPWPSWLVAAHPSPERAPVDDLRVFLERLTIYVRTFNSPESRESANIKFIEEHFGYPTADIESWLKTVGYPESCLHISQKVITDTLSVLEKAGVVKVPEGGFPIEFFVDTAVAKLA
ncbi:hypothetical protein H0H87_010981 [Tephrocybe sp. NHM501043]|nr:hypothetical protein H0H87_010981 [Tephrocybe sp. NHM501043]